ncbi:MAG: hypothetical protein MJE68_09530 [Proteobacteria bacterium]|nr:hypothetical protein [Pseudomonadota bacterium]
MAEVRIDWQLINKLRESGFVKLGDSFRVNLDVINLFEKRGKVFRRAVWLLPRNKAIWFVRFYDAKYGNDISPDGKTFTTKRWPRDNRNTRIIFGRHTHTGRRLYFGEFKFDENESPDNGEIWKRVAVETELPPPEADG